MTRFINFVIIFFYTFLFIYKKYLKIYQLNIIKKKKKECKKKPCEKYQSFSKEEKEKKQQNGRESCKNLSEDDKQAC